MFVKTVVLFCVQAFLVQTITAQCLGNAYNPGLSYGLNNGIVANNLGLGASTIGLANNIGACGLGSAVANGGGFTVTSSSPIAPSGVSVISEYVIEGPLNVGGQLPVLGAVAVEGQLPNGGAAGTTYSCGNGVGIIGESGNAGLANAGLVNAGAINGVANGIANGIGLANAGLGAGIGLGRPGCGY